MQKIRTWLIKRKRRGIRPLGTPAEHFACYPGAQRVVAQVVAKMPVYREEKAQ